MMQLTVVWDVEVYNPYRQQEFLELSSYRAFCYLHRVSASEEQPVTHFIFQNNESCNIILWFEAVITVSTSFRCVRYSSFSCI